MQDPADGIAGVMSFTIAPAQQWSYGNVSDVCLCLFHASRPFSAEEPQLQWSTSSSVNAEARERLATLFGGTAQGIHNDTHQVPFIIHITGIGIRALTWSRMLTDLLA